MYVEIALSNVDDAAECVSVRCPMCAQFSFVCDASVLTLHSRAKGLNVLLLYYPCRHTLETLPLLYLNSQGIPLKLLAVESLLENFPELRGKVIMFIVVRDDGRRGDR